MRERGEGKTKLVLRVTNCADDFADGVLQVFRRPVRLFNHLFPVPLVNVYRMEIVHFLVTTDGVHIRIYSFACGKTVVVERHALPFRKRMNNCRLRACFFYAEGYGTFNTVEVVIQSGLRLYEQRSGYPAQIERIAQLFFKNSVDHTDSGLCFVNAENGFVSLRHDCSAHRQPPFFIKKLLL